MRTKGIAKLRDLAKLGAAVLRPYKKDCELGDIGTSKHLAEDVLENSAVAIVGDFFGSIGAGNDGKSFAFVFV